MTLVVVYVTRSLAAFAWHRVVGIETTLLDMQFGVTVGVTSSGVVIMYVPGWMLGLRCRVRRARLNMTARASNSWRHDKSYHMLNLTNVAAPFQRSANSFCAGLGRLGFVADGSSTMPYT